MRLSEFNGLERDDLLYSMPDTYNIEVVLETPPHQDVVVCSINLKNQLLLLPSLPISEKTLCQWVPHVYWVPLRFPSYLVLLYLLSETTGWEFIRKKEMKTFDFSSKLSLSKKLWIQLELGLYMRVLGVVWFHSIEASCLTGFYYLQQTK